jgi:hypothetical protein
MASSAWADSAYDEAIHRAQDCSNDKAVKYSRETAEPAQTIAEAAFDACESLWQEVVNKWQAAIITPNGTPFTDQQLRDNPWLMSTSLAVQAADRERNGLPARRAAEIKRCWSLNQNGAYKITPDRSASQKLALPRISDFCLPGVASIVRRYPHLFAASAARK